MRPPQVTTLGTGWGRGAAWRVYAALRPCQEPCRALQPLGGLWAAPGLNKLPHARMHACCPVHGAACHMTQGDGLLIMVLPAVLAPTCAGRRAPCLLHRVLRPSGHLRHPLPLRQGAQHRHHHDRLPQLHQQRVKADHAAHPQQSLRDALIGSSPQHGAPAPTSPHREVHQLLHLPDIARTPPLSAHGLIPSSCASCQFPSAAENAAGAHTCLCMLTMRSMSLAQVRPTSELP